MVRDKPISRNAVSRALKDVSDTLGLNINTHSMRKSRSKALFDASVPIKKIAKVPTMPIPGLPYATWGLPMRQ